MPSRRRSTRRYRSRIGTLAVVLAVLAVLYVASVGPAAMLAQKGTMLNYGAMDKLYAPLWWACRRSPLTRKCTFWYVSLWERDTCHEACQ